MAAKVHVSEADLLNVYKKAYNIKIPLQEVLDDDIYKWLVLFEKATNCSKTMVLASLLSMTASLCGPRTDVVTVPNGGFRTTLNQYLISVCDPGGGKSNVFYRIIQPVIDMINQKHAIALQLETYTNAGVQNHQIMNKGYGLITSDEGHQFLATINLKQSKGEAEKSLLCKMWGGRGDTNTLAGGNRGFKTTSMSMCLFIQPEPLITELVGLKGNDGLLDRMLFFAAKPIFNKSATCFEHLQRLQQSPLKSFEAVMDAIYMAHKHGKTYVLSDGAVAMYNRMTDSYADYINDKYGSDEDEDKENSILDSQPGSTALVTSKDTQHILRLATVLHILQSQINIVLMGNAPLEVEEAHTQVPTQRLQQASKLYFTLQQHKDTFVQASVETMKSKVKLRPVRTFQERVVKAVCTSTGPMVLQRTIQRHIKGALAENIKHELEYMQRNGFGTLVSINGRLYFMKLPTECIDDEVGSQLQIMKTSGINLAEYDRAYCDTSKLGPEDKAILRVHHPQAELLMDMI